LRQLFGPCRNDDEHHEQSVFKFTNVELDVVRDADFTLPAFGIPEIPAAPNPGWFPLSRPLFWCALLLAVATTWYLWRRRHGPGGNQAPPAT
jgi:hypothetical protein